MSIFLFCFCYTTHLLFYIRLLFNSLLDRSNQLFYQSLNYLSRKLTIGRIVWKGITTLILFSMISYGCQLISRNTTGLFIHQLYQICVLQGNRMKYNHYKNIDFHSSFICLCKVTLTVLYYINPRTYSLRIE